MSSDLFLSEALLADGSVVDILIESGRIASVTPNGSSTPENVATEELAGALVLPGLVEGHIHLDKTLLGIPWVPHLPGDSVAERIAAEKRLRRELDAPIETRARALLERCVAYGTTAMRCHVDIDAEIGLRGLEALLALRAACAELIDIQFVAFPQSGLVTHPGARELMDEALRNGATVVGGLDPAGIDNDVEGQLDAIFALAQSHAAKIDIHLHDPGELGAFELRQIAERARMDGLEGRVAVSHAFALGELSAATFGATAEALARGGVAIMTNGPGPVPMPPVKRLRDHGVRVFTGSDNIRDAWSPLGNGDLLEGAARIAWRQGFASDEDLRLALALVTEHAAAVLGREIPAIVVGAAADLVVVRAANTGEAVAAHPPRALVVKRGRIVARDGRLAL